VLPKKRKKWGEKNLCFIGTLIFMIGSILLCPRRKGEPVFTILESDSQDIWDSSFQDNVPCHNRVNDGLGAKIFLRSSKMWRRW
jgi:hypothetical protein